MTLSWMLNDIQRSQYHPPLEILIPDKFSGFIAYHSIADSFEYVLCDFHVMLCASLWMCACIYAHVLCCQTRVGFQVLQDGQISDMSFPMRGLMNGRMAGF